MLGFYTGIMPCDVLLSHTERSRSLAVIGFRAVFAQIVFIQQRLLHIRQLRRELPRKDAHVIKKIF